MAFLIPENISTRPDTPAAVQAVARALRDTVDDTVTVWLDRDGDGAPPYLTVLDPAAGVALIDVPPMRPRELRGGSLFRRRQPAVDVREEALRRASALGRTIGAEGRLPERLGVASIIALPQVPRSDRGRLGLPDGVPALFEEDFAPTALRPAIQGALGGNGHVLTDVQERVVRGIVRPEIIISGGAELNGSAARQLVFRPPEVAPDDVIRVLDRQQERLAHHLGDGYRVIRGVAGSGKSLVLTYRARWFAQHFPARRVLMLCYNRPLSKALESQLSACPSVTVCTVDSLAWRTLQGAGIRPLSETDDDWTRNRERATSILRQRGGNYDVVLVDEGQDLDTAGLDLAYAALRPGATDFIMALDGAQNVYRKKARWNPPEQTARGRTTVLKVNYRNTKEILEFATRFLTEGTLSDPDEAALEDPTVIVPAEAAARRGPEPRVILCRDAADEAERILDLVEERHKNGTPWGGMAVLYGTHDPFQRRLYHAAKRRGVPYFCVSRGARSRGQVMEVGDVLRSATCQGLKGLEFSRVFICGVNQIRDPGGVEDDTVRRILYVAMTRAMDELVITVSGRGAMGKAIQAAVG